MKIKTTVFDWISGCRQARDVWFSSISYNYWLYNNQWSHGLENFMSHVPIGIVTSRSGHIPTRPGIASNRIKSQQIETNRNKSQQIATNRNKSRYSWVFRKIWKHWQPVYETIEIDSDTRIVKKKSKINEERTKMWPLWYQKKQKTKSMW